VEASDAHAWVQVWFPYYGWQSFDPTAVVPLANPSPAHVLLHDVAAILARAPWVPAGVPLVVLFGAGYALRAWRRRPQTWAEQVARRLGRLGARARLPRRPGETLTEFASRLDASRGDPSGTLTAVAKVAEGAAYGRREPAPELRAQLDATLRASPLRRSGFRIDAPGVLTPTAERDPDRTSHLR